MRTWICAVALGLWCLHQAAVACQLRTPGGWAPGTYKPTASAVSTFVRTVRIEGGRNGCQASLQVVWKGSGTSLPLEGPGGLLRVNATLDAAGSQALPAAPLDVVSVRLDPRRSLDLPVWLGVAAGQWLAAGTYGVSLRWRLVNAAGQSVDEQDTAWQLDVEPAVRLGFGAGTSRESVMDFGELAEGATRSTTLMVRANAGYRLQLDSRQGGQLAHSRALGPGVPYILRVDGVATQPRRSGWGLQGQAGLTTHQLQVEIGRLERVLAGDYADELLFTVTAQ